LGRKTRFLFRLVRLPLLGSSLLGVSDRLAPGVRGFILGRTRYIDDALIAALGEGIDQVVILGAGYDSRAYRLPGIESSRVFELDLPCTQAQKRRCMERLLDGLPDHVTLVPLDLESRTLSENLSRSGFKEGCRSFFVCEGLTEELSPAAVDGVFRYVAGTARQGSMIAFTYLVRGLLDGSKNFPGTRFHVRYSGFSIRHFTINPEELPAYLSRRGLELVGDVAGADFAEWYFTPTRRRVRTNEFHRTALARVSG
jgi:methyltransferase (TIGR00027 family)